MRWHDGVSGMGTAYCMPEERQGASGKGDSDGLVHLLVEEI